MFSWGFEGCNCLANKQKKSFFVGEWSQSIEDLHVVYRHTA